MIDTQAIRKKILDLALRGKLTEQLPEDGTAKELYQRIQQEKPIPKKAKKNIKGEPDASSTQRDIPFEIPSTWIWVEIGDIFTLQAGKNITADRIADKQSETHSYPCYGGNGLRGFVSQYNTSGLHALIGRQGALCGNINFADGEFYATEHAVVVDVYAETNTLWAGLFLRALNLNQYATSVAQPGLAVNRIEKVLIPLPPILEQKRIVERIESSYSVLDTIDTLQSQYQDNLATLKSKIIDAGIQGKLTEQLLEDGTAEELYQQIQQEKLALEKAGKIKKAKPLPPISDEEKPFDIPDNWKWVRLADVYEINPKVNADDNINAAFIPMERISAGFDRSFSYVVQKWSEASKNHTRFCDGDVAFAKISPCFENRKSFVVENLPNSLGGGTTELIILRQKLIDPLFTYYLILDERFIRLGLSTYKGTVGQQRIKNDVMFAYVFPLPPLAEQKRIVAKLEELLPLCEGK